MLEKKSHSCFQLNNVHKHLPNQSMYSELEDKPGAMKTTSNGNKYVQGTDYQIKTYSSREKQKSQQYTKPACSVHSVHNIIFRKTDTWQFKHKCWEYNIF